MRPRALLFEPPRGVVLVSADAADDLPGWSRAQSDRLPHDVSADERDRVLAAAAADAADSGATIVLVWEEGVAPFTLWIQLTPIARLGIAQEFVRSSASSWVGTLAAPHIGLGLEWFAAASEDDAGWAAAFADDELFVQVTLDAATASSLVARRALVEVSVLPSLVIAAGDRPWRASEAFPSGVITPKESWPQLADAGAMA